MTSENIPWRRVEEPLLVDIEVPEPTPQEPLEADASGPPITVEAQQGVAEPQPQERARRPRLRAEEPSAAAPERQEPARRLRLGEERPIPAPPAGNPPSQPRVGRARAGTLVTAIRAEQSLAMGIVGGVAAAMAGAIAWGTVTVVTNFQIGWMAVGVGFLVGSAIRALGKGIDKPFGYAGAVLSVFGCLLGNLLSICALLGRQEGLGLWVVLTHLDPAAIPGLMAMTFHPINLLFYLIAVYEGYHFSFRRVTQADVARAAAREVSGIG